MTMFAAVIPTTICLCFAGYGWSQDVSGWGWWILLAIVFSPTVQEISNKSKT